MCAVVNRDIQKIIRHEIQRFHRADSQYDPSRHQIFNFKTPAKSETSSRTQTQLGLRDLEKPQMGTRTQERDK